MDQEKFTSLNQPSNANMPRDTVETLKQIQKQGLSISIVKGSSGSFTLPSTTSADSRQKQNVLTVDKPKILPRPQTATDNKIIQSRLTSADTRVSTGRVTTQSSFHDSKTAVTQTRQTQPAVSETKGFNQVWSSPNTSVESKTQSSLTTPTTIKMQTSQIRMNQIHIPDNKTPVSRSNQNMLSENKNQGRVIQGQRVIQHQQLIDGKILSNDRMNPTSPPDAKVFSNLVRTGQQFVAPQENKPNPAQRVVAQKISDVKITSQLNTNKQVDKIAQVNRVNQSVKVLPEPNQGKIRQNYPVKPEAKPSISGNSPLIVENKTVRLVTNVVESGTTRTTSCKSGQMRLHPNVSSAETPPAVQTQMICAAVTTTKIISYHQNVLAQPDKNMILQGAKVTASSDMPQKTTAAFDESAHGNPMSSRPPTSKRSTTVFGSPAKKKCVKRIIPSLVEASGKSQDANNVTSPEDANENSENFFNNLKTSRTGLTITPVRAAASSAPPTVPNAVGVRMPGELIDKDVYRLAWENSAMLAAQRGKPRSRGRRKYVEPVCLTLSSDDEEEHMQAPFNSIEEEMNQGRMFPHESEGSKSGQSSPAYQDEENPESEDPQFPGVTDLHTKSGEGRMHYEEDEEEDEEEKDMDEMEMDMEEEESIGDDEEEEMDESDMEEEEEEEEEEVPPEDDEELSITKTPLENISSIKQPLHCRSIRIGSFKIHPKTLNSVLNVYLAVDGISFNAPMVSDASKVVNVVLKPCDVTQLCVHFGKCLPILFIFTTPSFGENVRKLLNMSSPDCSYYDPTSNDEKVTKITFLIDIINEEQRRFLRYTFLTDKKVRELDQKTANEILVTSTPSRTQYVRCEVAQPFQVSQENTISVTTIQPTLQILKAAPPPPPEPVIKLFTYPPPPQTGGITITNEDVACLNEGEFLNDAIIDFYLKYVFYEKLSDYHREKTHIFSSYFYPRLTHKQERPRAGEETQKSVQIRRHNMVKTWTRHVDIFSKDFIVIPVNQNVHWFLAIICYPGLVPEVPEPPPKPESKTNNKSSDNVTSTDDQEGNKIVKEPNSTIDGSNQNSDENSTASSNSMFEPEEPDSEEPMPEAPDSSTHPDKNRRRKEAPCICIFDSLNGPNRSRIATMLREYLEIEWKMKKGTRKVFDKNTMQGFMMQCPQQNNYSDCGIYVLQYVESFFENPLPYFDSPIPNLTNWFTKEKVSKKRRELTELILALKKKYDGTATASTTTTTTTTVRKQNVSDSVPSSPAQTLQTDNR